MDRRLAAALAVATLLGGCTRTTAHSPKATRLVERPLPSTAAGLTSELALVVYELERPGDTDAADRDRQQACIRLSRLREEAAKEKLVPADRLVELDRADTACTSDPSAAASHVRTAVRS